MRDFFKPSGLSQTQGNQQASYVSRFIFPGKTPFAVYAQYAGEDNSDGGSYLLGNAALSVGIDFPRVWHHFDLTYEISEWQNIWYVHNIFLDGMTNDGLVLGNWGADQRNFGDGVGARTQMLRIGWEPPFGGYLQERVRTAINQTYYGGDVRQYSPGEPAAISLPALLRCLGDVFATVERPHGRRRGLRRPRYLRPVLLAIVGIRALWGRSTHARRRRGGGRLVHRRPESARQRGLRRCRRQCQSSDMDLGPEIPQTTTLGLDPHFALGARRAVSRTTISACAWSWTRSDHTLYGFRAIDYRYRFGDSFAFGSFFGVDRYQLATPAYSEYGGVGAQWRNFLLSALGLGFDFRYAQNIARDHVLPTDPNGSRPDSFYKIDSAVLYLSRHF